MKKNFCLWVFAGAFILSGCAKIAHIDELLRLQGYSKEKDRQRDLVSQQNKNFERLLKAAKTRALNQYPDAKSICAAFGPPIFEKKVALDKKIYSVWMYRYATKFFGSDKVYLYFDTQGTLKIYDFSPGGNLTMVHPKSP